MRDLPPLPPTSLSRRSDPASFSFGTTAELPDVPGIIGQERAEEAVRFAIGIRRYGYNLYALGTSGMGKHGFVRAFLERRAASEKAPSDWCYVHDFADPRRPRALRLPPGRGPLLREDLQQLRRGAARRHPRPLRERGLPDAEEAPRGTALRAEREGLRRHRGEGAREGRRHREDAGRGWDGPPAERRGDRARGVPEAAGREQERIKAEMVAVQQDLQDALVALPREARRHRDEMRRLDRLVTASATGHLVDEMRARWADVPAGARVPRRRREGRRRQRRGLPAGARGGERGEGPPRRARARRGRRTATRSTCWSPGRRRSAPRSCTRTTRPTPTSWAASSTWPSSATSSPTSR